MKITLMYSAKRNTSGGNWLGANLNDMVWSLNNVLKRYFKGSCEAVKSSPGLLVIETRGVDQPQVEPYIKAFADAMETESYKLVVNYG